MKPTAFKLLRPSGLDEATTMLAEEADTTVLLAGGQSLVPLMNMRLVVTDRVIDLNEVFELASVSECDGGIRTGAMTRHRAVETSALVRQWCPILAYAERFVGHIGIRRRGTIGGSVAHADPVAELTCLAVVLGATVVLRSHRGVRELSASDFLVGNLLNSREPDEMLTDVRWPFPRNAAIWGFSEFAPRAGDFPYVTAAAVGTDEGVGCRNVRLGIGGLSPVPVRITECEQYLEGKVLNEQVAVEAGRIASSVVSVPGGQRLAESYLRNLASTTVTRALRQAMSRVDEAVGVQGA